MAFIEAKDYRFFYPEQTEPALNIGNLQIEKGSYVWQNPESQIVTDRVEYEIVFGLENIGMPREQMQRRLAEVVTFFGLEDLADCDTMNLSGGELQTMWRRRLR